IQASPRLLLAVIIAVVISKPLELKIFEKEINQVLLEQKNDLTLANKDQIALQYNPKTEALQQNITALQNEVTTKEAEVNALYDIYINEAEGTAGTNLLGKGPVYKEKREKHDAALAELQTLKQDNKAKIEATEAEILALKTEYDTKIAHSQPIIDGFDGLMARVNALGTLPWLPSFFIFLLFLAIETSPIFAKLLSPKGEYDFKLEDQETAIKTIVEQKTQERKLILKTDFEVNDKVYSAIAEEDELYNYKRKKARELMQAQADAFYKKQQKLL
ncbi:DUF4407 domain-containing protein, partial [Pontimicrobium sp. MEBiC01747]